MEKNIDHDEDFHKIKVFSSEDEKLKILGELLSNKSSRDIIRLLIDREMYVNEIAKKLELKVSLVVHHLQKMEAIGLLEITNKKITQKGEEHRFFRIPSGMLIFPKQSEEEVNNVVLKKIFKDGMKFAAIGIATISSFIGVSTVKTKEFISNLDELDQVVSNITETESAINFEPYFYGLIVLSCCVFLYLLNKK